MIEVFKFKAQTKKSETLNPCLSTSTENQSNAR